MEYRERSTGSVSTLINDIKDLYDEDHILYFRGHSDKSYELTPYLYRDKAWFSNEDKMVREIIMRCPDEFSQMTSSFEKLVKMQHYNLPTRLLDLTGNPLVALYFACAEEPEKPADGEVIIFKIPKDEIKFFDSDTVSILSNIAWAKNDFEFNVNSSSKSFHSPQNHHAIKLMHDIKQEKPYFQERIEPRDISRVLCVRPKMDNQRLIRQDGVFLLFGIEKTKYQPASIPSGWRWYPDKARIIIKNSSKKTLLKQLKNLGVSRANLFPEIDMVAQFIKYENDLKNIRFQSSNRKIISSPPFS